MMNIDSVSIDKDLTTDYEMIFSSSDNYKNQINYKEQDKKLFREKCPNFKYYPPIMSAVKRIIAIGDLHGDFDLTIRVLKLAKLIDNNHKWIGGETVVVQVGDQLDNCRPFDKKCEDPESDTFTSSYSNDETPEDIKVLEFFTKLNFDAEKTGGKVISLLGNHEILNVMGNMNYVSYNDVKKFKSYKDNDNPELAFKNPKDARIHAFKPGNKYAKDMACTRLPAVIIGSFVFAHAGFINHFMEKMNIKSRNDLYKISLVMRKWLLNIIDQENIMNILTHRDSLFWDRVLGSIPPNMSNNHPDCKKYLKKSLDILEVHSMVIGHTPQSFSSNSGINSTCDNKLWRIDFGGSFGFNKFDMEYNKNGNIYKIRKAQVLEILNDETINILSE